ncbi:MAG: hypothetical protein KAU20_02230 [Nanoarchaeota archaeon]|nr:hypothetical protein [Nanoarchaeota archaeon]
MKDLKLTTVSDPTTQNPDHDLAIENYDLVLIDGIEQVAQNLRIRLWFFFGEWFLDTSQGVRFFEDVNVKEPNFPNIESLLKDMILSTQDVQSLLEFTMEYDRTQRKLTVEFTVNTTFGQLPITEEL